MEFAEIEKNPKIEDAQFKYLPTPNDVVTKH